MSDRKEGVNIMLSNFDFDVRCLPGSYSLVRVGKNEDPVEAFMCEKHQGKYSESARKLVDKAQPGDIYYFDQVTCKCPGDMEERKINSLVFKVK